MDSCSAKIIGISVILLILLSYLIINSVKKKWRGLTLTVLILTVTFVLASFHFIVIPTKTCIVAKSNISFSRTFFTQYDLDELIEYHNQSSSSERFIIRQEPFYKKLMELKIVESEK